MIYKKRLALLLVILMSLSMNLNLYASESDKITEIQESNVDSDIKELGTEGYLHAVYSLDAAGNYESTGKKTAYMQKSDGTYTTVEFLILLRSIIFTENCQNIPRLLGFFQNDSDKNYLRK